MFSHKKYYVHLGHSVRFAPEVYQSSVLTPVTGLLSLRVFPCIYALPLCLMLLDNGYIIHQPQESFRDYLE